MAGLVYVDEKVTYFFRDREHEMEQAWASVFKDYKETIKVSQGDIFEDAPAVDAVVSPANSFGFMTGGVDATYTRFFGSQLQKRLQKIIRVVYDGELLVGQAIVMPTYGPEGRDTSRDWSQFNEGQPIKYLISAPSMRVAPLDIQDTPNAYLTFRAVILAIRRHNRQSGCEPIKRVLVPGLGTNTGRMPFLRCAWQMFQAYETHVIRQHPPCPTSVGQVYRDHHKLCQEGYWVDKENEVDGVEDDTRVKEIAYLPAYYESI